MAALAVPATPTSAAPVAGRDCAGDFTARAQADLAKITVLDPGPLARGLPALADVRLGSAKGDVDSAGRPYRSVAAGRHADATVLGLPADGAGARHAAPGPGTPSEVDLTTFQAAGLATASLGKSTAHATWDERYRCGGTGPLTRAATMLGGLSVLDGSGTGPAMLAGDRRTSLLRIGPTGSAQSAADLVRLPDGSVGVRSSAGVAVGDLSLFAGTPQEISVKVITQPTLEAVAGGDRATSAVTYRPAVLRVSAAGKPAHVLKDSGAAVSLGLLGGVERYSPAALEVRVSLGEVRQSYRARQVRAEAATLRLEVKVGRAHLLDVALGHLSVAACAPARVAAGKPGPGQGRPVPSPVGRRDAVPAAAVPAAEQPAAAPPAVTATADSPAPADPPAVALPAGPSGGTGGGDLALTGSDATVVGFAGAGLVMAGLISLVLTRRRPTRK
ncbi:hypothetical protein [Actinoplanes utahensis]|uniref:hypothetical protein n=1 Tax=Actinoplanes utahensis TaxID=1869 RepID=UPI00126A3FE0|nr:hypothetical protein [Actinoplanes utahensis]